jgi:hypothetical protein
MTALYPSQTFETLLATPLEQFDPRSELLAGVLASISEYASAASNTPSWIPPSGVLHGDDEPLLDPDCRDGKHQSCVGPPCECPCHAQAAP